MNIETSRTARRPAPLTSLIFGLLLGLMYQLLLSIFQPAIEPNYVWLEVVVGTALAFLAAEAAVAASEPTWRAYQVILLAAFLGEGLPIVLYEVAHHSLGLF